MMKVSYVKFSQFIWLLQHNYIISTEWCVIDQVFPVLVLDIQLFYGFVREYVPSCFDSDDVRVVCVWFEENRTVEGIFSIFEEV